MFHDTIAELEKELGYYKRLQEERDSVSSKIKLGARIIDTEMNKTGTVDGLKKGCIDFSVRFDDNTVGRGYTFLSGNFRVI